MNQRQHKRLLEPRRGDHHLVEAIDLLARFGLDRHKLIPGPPAPLGPGFVSKLHYCSLEVLAAGYRRVLKKPRLDALLFPDRNEWNSGIFSSETCVTTAV